MTTQEAIEAVRGGGRCKTDTTLFDDVQPSMKQCIHHWRTVACDSETDVIECGKCGLQALAKCDFDEEFD